MLQYLFSKFLVQISDDVTANIRFSAVLSFINLKICHFSIGMLFSELCLHMV